MGKKLTYKFVKEQIEKEGYKLISDLYVNAHTKLKVKCPKEHEYEVKWNDFQQGYRCSECKGGIKLKYEFIKEQIKKEGYVLLSKEYKNNLTKLKIRCNKGHIIFMRYGDFQQGKRCRICWKENNIKENHHRWRGGSKYAFYDTYASQIEYAEEVRRSPDDENILEVKCAYCGKWYIPTMTNVVNRIQVLNGNGCGESNFYCSNKCKQLCPVFNRKNYQVGHPKLDKERPYQQEWSKIVKENSNFECEICSSKDNLIVHHILPVKTYPHLQADVDNGVCLCENCHMKKGHIDECSTGNLARMVC